MRASVIASWVLFSEKLEGLVYSVYADLKGLQTTGMGNLLPTLASSAALPWRRPDGSLAPRAEIEAEWRAVGLGCCQAMPDRIAVGLQSIPGADYETCRWPGKRSPTTGAPCYAHQGHRASEAHVARLRLRPEDVDALIRRKLASDWAILRGRWPGADAWPADAQMAVASWAWGVGPRANWPLFARALSVGDFGAAANEVSMRGVGSIPERNAKNKLLLRNAALVVARGFDRDVLYWPTALSDERPTEPELPAPPSSAPATTEPPPPASSEPAGPASSPTRVADRLVDYRAELPAPTVTVLPDTLMRCALCHRQSCGGDCP
ncbi:MAG: hypothetical protein KF764_08655 [Labilithrix sp.]|nr:hypothetical protein [Labilithrix sp.]